MSTEAHVPAGTTITFSVGSETYEAGYTEDDVGTVLNALSANKFVHCDESAFGEVWVSPYNVQYVQAGRRPMRRTTASSVSNTEHNRLVGGQSL